MTRKKNEMRAGQLVSLHLENWRNFLLVDAELSPRIFVVGPNASGKSNLLDAIRFLFDLSSVGGGFQEAIRRRGGVSKIRALAARRYPGVLLRAGIVDREGVRWDYELKFVQDNLRQPMIAKERVMRNGDVLLDRPGPDDTADTARLRQTHLEQVNVNKEFRAIPEFFQSIKYLHIVPQLVRDPDRSVGRKNDPYGGDFLEQIAKTQDNTLKARLRKIRETLQVAVPQLTDLELWRDERGGPHLRGRYEHWRPQGAWQTEDQFSDGTLRLLGLLWTVLDGSGPLLLEEPELSLHPAVVRFLPQMFARLQSRTGRQIIVSTHSTDLLQDQGIGLGEVLLLTPGTEGTQVRAASQIEVIRTLLSNGYSMADAAMPFVKPEHADQLSLFGATA